jgi:hypothetical protein
MIKLVKLFAVLVFGFSASSVNASTVFSPEINIDGTFENVDFFFVGLPANYQLGLFDNTDTAFTNALMVATGDAVAFTPNVPGAAPYSATNTVSGNTLGLAGATAEFILGLKNTNTGIWLADVSVNPLNLAGTAFNVIFETAPGTLLAVDLVIAQVPVPAAIWLFGSGLLGLIGVARRKNA